MSSILKSLRKIEEEKRGAVRAAPDLRVDQGFAPVKSKQLLPLLTGLALGAVIVGLFFLWAPGPTLPEVKNQPPAVVKDQPPAIMKDKPPAKTSEVVSAVKQEPKAPAAGQVVGAGVEERVVAPVVVVAATASAVSSELPEGVSLLVTEIFFQEDSANSMAVVNDLPVMIGTYVDSAVVTEIHSDRVLFKIGSKVYTVIAPKR